MSEEGNPAGLSSNTTVQKHQFSALSFLHDNESNSSASPAQWLLAVDEVISWLLMCSSPMQVRSPLLSVLETVVTFPGGASSTGAQESPSLTPLFSCVLSRVPRR